MSIFNFLGNDKNYVHAGIAFFLAGFFGFLSMIMLGTIVAAPDKFVVCFTFTIFALIAGLASMNGPRTYIKNLFREKNLIATGILLTCIIASLYFSMIERAYLMSILLAVLELNAVLYFFCKAGFDLTTLKYMWKAFVTMLQGLWNTARGVRNAGSVGL